MPDVTRVGLVAKHRLDAAAGILAELAGWLEAQGVRAVFEAETAVLASLPPGRPTTTRDQLPKACDVIVVMGGDGTLIGMAGRIAHAGVDVPIVGVNFGSLGFLTEITLPELYPTLEAVLAGKASMEERMMLHAQTIRRGQVAAERFVLNDVVITRAALSRIVELSVSVDGQRVMKVRADGLIVATPTGSTAYNLAAGGPIAHPAVDGILLTPIAPHMLTNRPLMIPGGSTIEVTPKPDGSHEEVFVTFDGQSGHPAEGGDIVKVRRTPRPLRLIRASTRSYFDVLRQKLKWGER